MNKNFDPSTMQEAMKLANSRAGQQLLAHLQSNNSEALNAAMSGAADGDYSKVKQELSSMLSSPQVQALLEQLRRDSNG